MPRACTVCSHPERAAIDRALVAGETFRNIAKRHGLTPAALFRHRNEHLPETLVQARAVGEMAHADDLLAQLATLRADARRIGAKAEQAQDYRAALAGVCELVRIVELQARLAGELRDGQALNIVVSPEWAAQRGRIVAALVPFPAARAAVAGALAEGAGGHAGA